jgi:Rha family phage regulatory protein
MTLHHDLFPESLVVTLVDGQPMTSSLEIAAHFGKRHDHVMAAIRSQIAGAEEDGDFEFSLPNFRESTYTNARGKTYPMYLLTKDGFNLTVMGFTGKEAGRWQRAFIRAFNALEAELRAKEARFAHALDQIRPTLRPVVECTEQGQSRAEIAQQVNRTPATITRTRNKARTLGLLPQLH